jgi:hypothetical protein
MSCKAWMVSMALVVSSASVYATESLDTMPVGNEQQCTMFKRIFSYDKHLRDSERIIVIVVGTTRRGPDVVAAVQSFRENGMFPAAVTVDMLSDTLTSTLERASTAVYVLPGVDYDAVAEFVATQGFLSVSGIPSLAEQGQVSVSVDLAAGRPQVVVNMPRLKSEGHELSAELLKLARIIR